MRICLRVSVGSATTFPEVPRPRGRGEVEGGACRARPPLENAFPGPVDEQERPVTQSKAAGDDLIGGLRCSVCGCAFIPSETTRNELCRACHYQIAFRERFSRTDTRFNRTPRGVA